MEEVEEVKGEEVADLHRLAGLIGRGTTFLGFVLGVSFTHLSVSLDVPWWVRLLLLAAEWVLIGLLLRWTGRYVLKCLLMVYRSGFTDGLRTASRVYRQIVRFKGRSDRL